MSASYWEKNIIVIYYIYKINKISYIIIVIYFHDCKNWKLNLKNYFTRNSATDAIDVFINEIFKCSFLDLYDNICFDHWQNKVSYIY